MFGLTCDELIQVAMGTIDSQQQKEHGRHYDYFEKYIKMLQSHQDANEVKKEDKPNEDFGMHSYIKSKSSFNQNEIPLKDMELLFKLLNKDPIGRSKEDIKVLHGFL